MPRSLISLFDHDLPRHRSGVVGLIISDYLAAYRPRGESAGRLALLFIPRLLANPELHAAALLRIALGGPRFLMSFWRTVLIAKHSIETQGGVTIGPGLRLPHPFGITIGPGTVIGRDVTIYHSVTLGALPPVEHLRRSRYEPSDWINATSDRPSREPPCPTLEDEVIILPGSMVLGSITLGRGAVVGAGAWVDHDLPPGKVHRGSHHRS